MKPSEQVLQILSNRGFSMTKPRLLIFKHLAAIDKPVTLSGLAQTMPSVNRASIYRTVALFEDLGIVHRVWNGFKSKIELSDIFSPHHHHFTCDSCGGTQALDSEDLERSLHRLESQLGFRITQHSVELKGTCPVCLNA